ncbi:unnamed protein product [Vitrella brassicaformis CCMP3155]|uniref:Pentapeptide repeat protein n=1 Tax=Vitrella brassicaformis (strain CCMP3155) TaxID=1169540 RepID=A0A0G4EER2_VITBC|nr:unnamed protein product [Vitrella brassicaformis CCMP3155]|eukprot:CEL93857.1 unnamed protein product [Vitrella brassicaformis CCMP3155]
MEDSRFDGANFKAAVVDRVTFKRSDLRNVNFAAAVLSGSTFEDANVENTDFSDVVIGDFEQRSLCKNPTLKGSHPKTGVDTRESLGCRS